MAFTIYTQPIIFIDVAMVLVADVHKLKFAFHIVTLVLLHFWCTWYFKF